MECKLSIKRNRDNSVKKLNPWQISKTINFEQRNLAYPNNNLDFKNIENNIGKSASALNNHPITKNQLTENLKIKNLELIKFANRAIQYHLDLE